MPGKALSGESLTGHAAEPEQGFGQINGFRRHGDKQMLMKHITLNRHMIRTYPLQFVGEIVQLGTVRRTVHTGQEHTPDLSCAHDSGELGQGHIEVSFLQAQGKDLIGFLYPREIFPEIRKNRWFKKYMNPESKVIMSRLPPMILISSKGDFLKKYTREYAKALEDAGHDSKLVYYGEHKELKHAFPTLHPELPESRDALERVLRWFDQHK